MTRLKNKFTSKTKDFQGLIIPFFIRNMAGRRRTTKARPNHRLTLATLCIAVSIALPATSKAQPEVQFDILARTGLTIDGYGPIADIGTGPSINNVGKVSFIARNQAGVLNGRVFVIHEGKIQSQFEITPLQVINNDSQINDIDQVTWRDQVTTNSDTFIRRWEIATGGGAVPGIGSLSFFNTPFTFVYDSPSINNVGLAVFGADLRSGGTVLASRNGGTGLHNTSAPLSGSPVFVPMVADNGLAVIRGGRTESAPLVIFTEPTLDVNKAVRIGSESSFTVIGQRPGISDDGSLVVFMGANDVLGAGIFGFHTGAKYLFKIAGDLGLSSVGRNTRVAVNYSLGTVNEFNVVYLATGLSAVPGQLGPQGLYLHRIDLARPSSPVVHDPFSVVKVGDSIPPLPGTITDIQIHDPVNQKNQLVFWVRTTSGDQAIVKATIGAAEAIVYETSRPVNQARSFAINDIPRLLLFRDCGTFYTGTTTLQQRGPAAVTTFYYAYDELNKADESVRRLAVQTGTFGALPVATSLQYSPDSLSDVHADYQIRYGLDSTLRNPQLFRVHLITEDNYRDSTRLVDSTASDFGPGLARTLFRKFVRGQFQPEDVAYHPNGIQGTTVGGYGNRSLQFMFDHNFGARFSGVDSTATAIVPFFKYDAMSAASRLVAAQTSYVLGVKAHLLDIVKFTDVDQYYKSTCNGRDPCNATLTEQHINFNSGWTFIEIPKTGLGRYTGDGEIVVRISSTGDGKYSLRILESRLNVEDLFDFNYFGGGVAGFFGFNQAAASVQAGFGVCGHSAGVGEAFVVSYSTKRSSWPISSTLNVSRQVQSIPVPNIQGLFWTVGQSELLSKDLNVGSISLEISSTVPPWNIIRQEPPSGALVPDGSAVALVVSAGTPSFLPGDVNADRRVDCADLAIIKAAFGKRAGEAQYDGRADMDGDGVVDIADLAFVAQRLSSGVRC